MALGPSDTLTRGFSWDLGQNWEETLLVLSPVFTAPRSTLPASPRSPCPCGSLMDFRWQELSKAANVYLLSLCRRLLITSSAGHMSFPSVMGIAHLKPLGWQEDRLDTMLFWSCHKSHCPGDLPGLLPPERVFSCYQQ